MFFGLFEFIFPIMFLLIFALFIVTLVRNIGEWHKNNQSPVLDVEAAVVSKRTTTSSSVHDNGNGAMHTTTDTTHYVTFQFHSNDRQEFRVTGRQYGMLAEGDVGMLTFQGTRFLNFQRR